MSKKLISLLLAVMLTISMVAVAAVSVSAETNDDNQYVPDAGVDTQRVYFMMPSTWYNDCATGAGIYWWEETGACSAWPGYTAYEADMPNVYYCDVPMDVVTFIWNNGFDGGDDVKSPDYSKAVQTVNIAAEGYDEGDSELYPEGTNPDTNFDGMIYIINPDWISINDYSGKETAGGSWFYYYGEGKYGYYEDEAEAAAKGVLFTSDTNTVADRSAESDVEITTTEPVETTEATEATTAVVETEEPTTVAEETEPVVVDNKAPLTVNAVSNLFGEATAQYNAETNEVVVTYYFSADKKVENVQYALTFDQNVFEQPNGYDDELDWYSDYSSELFGYDGVVNLDANGSVKFNTSTVTNGFEAKEGTIFAQFRLKVKDIAAMAPVSTTIDLDVESMLIADYKARKVVPGTEEHLAFKSEINGDIVANRHIVTSTTLTDSTYVPVPEEPTTAPAPATPDEPTTVLAGLVATSNICPQATQTVKKGDVVTVNYFVDPTKDVLATQWSLTYDTSALKLVTVDMPQISAEYNNTVEGVIKADAASLNLFAVDAESPFVTATFEVLDDVTETVVDLNVEILLTADKNEDGSVNETSEEYVVLQGIVAETGYSNTSTNIVVGGADEPTTEEPTTEPVTEEPTTEPVTEEPTTEEPTTEPVTEEPTTEEPTTEPVTEEPTVPDVTTVTTPEVTTVPVADETTVPVESQPTTPDATSATGTTGSQSTADTATNNNANTTNNNGGAVQTGEASMAVIILSVLVAATAIMFVLRKKEMF